MKLNNGLIAAFLLFVAGCTAPYKPPVIAYGSSEFPGLVGLMEKMPPVQPPEQRVLEVLLVHGMCSHTSEMLLAEMDELSKDIKSNTLALSLAVSAEVVPTTGINIVRKSVPISGGQLNFTAIIWSQLTKALKEQLAFDETGASTDCAMEGKCSPKRAVLNGAFKDVLLNDCLADVMIYEGNSHEEFRRQMKAAILYATRNKNAPIVLISESLGSKMVFDALNEPVMNDENTPEGKAALHTISKIAQVFMAANQIPILSLAQQAISAAPSVALIRQPAPPDFLQLFLQRKRSMSAKATNNNNVKILLVNFTDPNDLLSYRLLPSKYSGDGVAVADVLVSNQVTLFGQVERPDTAHTTYMENQDVISLIACGFPRSKSCR